MTTHTNEPRLWLQDLPEDQRPKDLQLIACAECRHAMWHLVRGHPKPTAFCRQMHRETYSGDDSIFVAVCDGRLEADLEAALDIE